MTLTAEDRIALMLGRLVMSNEFDADTKNRQAAEIEQLRSVPAAKPAKPDEVEDDRA